MTHRNGFLCLVACLAVVGCSERDRPGAEPATASVADPLGQGSQKRMNATPHPDLPADACTLEGYWSFFESFARSAPIRQAHTAVPLRASLEPFRIALVDDRWVYAGSDAQGREFLDLQEHRQDRRFTVEYVRAEFDAEDEVVSTSGTPGTYTFDYLEGCWQLTAATR